MKMAAKKGRVLRLTGMPNERQKEFFASTARYTAYGGARGGGKSWALRRKLILLCLNYPGIKALLVRRSLAELRENHLYAFLSELGGVAVYKEQQKSFLFPNGSRILLGYMDAERDVLRYQGQEFDVIALDEATQLSEFQFTTLKACLRGANSFPKRMYLTCNPGGVGHAWVKRLFIDRIYRSGENADDYRFIPAKVYDNQCLLDADPGYLDALRSLPENLRRAWLDGSWDVFEGQYFTEFSREIHTCEPFAIPMEWTRFAALDYGFDMLAVLWFAADLEGRLWVYREYCRSGLTLSAAAEAVVLECGEERIDYIAASPDLWNRRQDSGQSGVMIMSAAAGLPTLIKADNRRIIGWRSLREMLACRDGSPPRLQIFRGCTNLISSLPALCHDRLHPEDAASHPHDITHSPEALRYGVMSYTEPPESQTDAFSPYERFTGMRKVPTIADY